MPCIACGRNLYQVDEHAGENQPYGGTEFRTHGHYGSTIYDPMDGHYLVANICDPCIALHPDRFQEGRDSRPRMEDGAVVGWDPVATRPLTPWHPTYREIDYAVSMLRSELDLADDPEDLPTD
jgi:hypothetical protein